MPRGVVGVKLGEVGSKSGWSRKVTTKDLERQCTDAILMLQICVQWRGSYAIMRCRYAWSRRPVVGAEFGGLHMDGSNGTLL